jgi:hypothetical protein
VFDGDTLLYGGVKIARPASSLRSTAAILYFY